MRIPAVIAILVLTTRCITPNTADAPTGFAIATSGFDFNSAGGLHTHLTLKLTLTLNYRSSDRTLWLWSPSREPPWRWREAMRLKTADAATTAPAMPNGRG